MGPLPRRTNPVGSCSCPFGRYPLGTLFDQHDHSNDRPIYFSILPLYVRGFGTRDNLIFVEVVVSIWGSLVCFSGWMENSETESGIHPADNRPSL